MFWVSGLGCFFYGVQVIVKVWGDFKVKGTGCGHRRWMCQGSEGFDALSLKVRDNF